MTNTKTNYIQTEIGLIPEDWKIVTLGEIGNFKNGVNKSLEDFGYGYPFANLMDVFGKSSIYSNKEFGLINSNEIDRKLYNLIEGDTLFIRSSVKPSGVGLTSVIENDLQNTVFSGFIIRYRDNGILQKEFKRHCFYNERFRNEIIASSTVSANTNINQEALKKIKIAIPESKKEQTAIAQALSDTDNLITNLQNLINKKRQLKQAAMHQLLTPKEHWETKKLGDIVEFKNGGAHENFVEENGKYIIVNSKFISQEGKVVKYSNSNLCPLYKGEITMVMSDIPNGKALAKCYIIEKDDLYTLNQRICAFKVNENIDEYFLYYMINRNKYYLSFDSGSGQTNLKKEEVLNCPVRIPKLKSEQENITKILYDIDLEIDILENKLEKTQNLKKGMMQNLLSGKIRLF